MEITARQQQILRLVGEGQTNGEIAKNLNVSQATVRTHLEQMYDRLDVCNRMQAVVKGIKLGLLDVDELG